MEAIRWFALGEWFVLGADTAVPEHGLRGASGGLAGALNTEKTEEASC